jgi:protocatechuate 4,5-dioxygenase beta chain
VARIIAGLCTSHVPLLGRIIDSDRTGEPYWQPIFKGYEPAKKWLGEVKPDVMIVVYNDHANGFTFQYTPTFAIGCAEEFNPADEGHGPRPVPVVKGHARLAWHMTESLVLDGFDMTIMNEMDVDHGLTVPLSLVCGKVGAWPFRVIPVCVNVIQYPQPTAARCFALGKAIRKAVESFDEDLKVVIAGTGGMSHQIHGERSGLINKEFDNAFLDRLTTSPAELTKITHAEYVREAGAEGMEIIMWLTMRGALDDDVDLVHRFYHVPAMNTAVGNLVLENKRSA